MGTKKKPLSRFQKRWHQLRAEASVRDALKRASSPRDINRALLSIVRALYPGLQTERQVHDKHALARAAFTRYLRDQG